MTRSIRVASVTLPSLTGTLRSARTITRFPRDVNTVRRLQLVEIHSDDQYVAIVAAVTCSLTMRI